MSELPTRHPISVCYTFPYTPDCEVERKQFIWSIAEIFEGGTPVLLVGGPEGIGKTTVLAQFAKEHSSRTIALFASTTSRLRQDPNYLRLDICNQMEFLLTGCELDGTEDTGEAFLRTKIFQLQKLARRTHAPIYFVADGFDELAENTNLQNLILDLLPLGLDGFRFVIGCDPDRIPVSVLRHVAHGQLRLTGFTLDETVKYFHGISLSRPALRGIYDSFRGLPSALDSVRRLLLASEDPESCVGALPDTQPDLFAREWGAINVDDDIETCSVAIAALDQRAHSIDDLARMLAVSPELIYEKLSGLSFLRIKDHSAEISFVSTPFRKFAANKLRHLERKVIDISINDLQSHPESANALIHLPGYLEQAGRLNELLDYLSPSHFTHLLQATQSLAVIREKAALGVRSAHSLSRDGDLMRFAVQEATITQFDGAQVWRSEVEALIALGNWEAALALAESTVLTEDRLQLLATVAKGQRKQKISPDPGLLEQIRLLYSQIDINTLGDRSFSIAADLLYAAPELAIEMVEKSHDISQGENKLDWAIARLSITTLAERGIGDSSTAAFESLRSRISDPKARQFTESAALLLGDYTATEAIAHVEKLPTASDKLFLLQQWTHRNRRRSDAHLVVEYAVKLMVSTTEYVPQGRTVRQLASPLPHIVDETIAQHLVGIFDSQMASVENAGPTEEYVRLQLLLARTEARYDFDAARNRLAEVYLHIGYVDDLVTKTACMSRLLSFLDHIDPDQNLETGDRLHSSATADLTRDLDLLLEGTAEHFEAVRGVIQALARRRPGFTLNLIATLNTEMRRDAAYLEFVRAAVEAAISHIPFAEVELTLARFSDGDFKDAAVINMVERLAREDSIDQEYHPVTLRLLAEVPKLRESSERCRACCLAYQIAASNDKQIFTGIAGHLLEQLRKSWETLDTGWHKVDVGFRISAALASDHLEAAKTYFADTEKLSKECLVDSETAAVTYIACLRLAVRALAGLLVRHNESESDIENVRLLIDRIPSSSERIALWSTLAEYAVISNRLELCARITNQHIRPLLDDLGVQSGQYRTSALISSAIALYYAHRPSALESISQLESAERDECYSLICNFILVRIPHTDPYEYVEGMPSEFLFHLQALDMIEVMGLMDRDSLIYGYVQRITDTLTHKKTKNNFSQEQRRDIVSRIQKIVDTFPRQRFIRHKGYKLAAEAQLLRVFQSNPADWQKLVDEALGILNTADRAYVLCLIASAMPMRMRGMSIETFEQAKQLIKDIPTQLDRAGRYEAMAQLAASVDIDFAKLALRSAAEASCSVDTPSIREAQRRQIDLAYRWDPSLAASIVSMYDQDPAREALRERMRARLKIHGLRQSLGTDSASKQPSADASDYARAAWLHLASLNANRCADRHFEQMRDLLLTAADLPLSHAYPVLSLVIQNSVKRHANTPHADKLIRPLFSAMLLSAELAGKMALRSSERLSTAKAYAFQTGEREKVVIRAGERERAVALIRDWLTEHLAGYLKISDPFFSPSELELLLLVSSINPSCKVQILTSRKHQETEKVPRPWDEAYVNHWRQAVSDQNPPETDIVIVGTASSGDSPVHDRWWITQGGGLRVGTSYNSLGLSKDSEISAISADRAASIEADLDGYFLRVVKEYDGQKLQYTLFNLL